MKTDPQEVKTRSGLWLPGKEQGTYGGPLHQRMVTATVVSAGPMCDVKVNERVAFQRMWLCKWKVLDDKTFVGWVHEDQVTGIVGDNTYINPMTAHVAGPKEPYYRPL